jgi:hypothetical protein
MRIMDLYYLPLHHSTLQYGTRVNFDVSFLYLPGLQSWPCTSPPCRSRSKPAPSGPVWDWLADVASAGSSTRPNWLSRLAGPPRREVRTETPSRRTSLSANQSTIKQSSEIPPHLQRIFGHVDPRQAGKIVDEVFDGQDPESPRQDRVEPQPDVLVQVLEVSGNGVGQNGPRELRERLGERPHVYRLLLEEFLHEFGALGGVGVDVVESFDHHQLADVDRFVLGVDGHVVQPVLNEGQVGEMGGEEF